MQVDAIVIGTGFGGAVTACRLAQAGAREGGAVGPVLVLERGRRTAPGDFPRPPVPPAHPGEAVPPGAQDVGFNGSAWAEDGGLWDVRQLGPVQVLGAAGFGGGSLLYAGVHMEPPAELLGQWMDPAVAEELAERFFPLAAHMVQARTPLVPNLEKTEAFAAGLSRWGGRVFSPRLAVQMDGRPAEPGMSAQPLTNAHGVDQASCSHCGECNLGCNEGAKNSLDHNYLAIAEGRTPCPVRPVRVVTGAEVHCLRFERVDGVAGVRVDWWDHLCPGQAGTAWAPHVFVCAGALGSTELLLRNRKNLVENESHRARSGLFGGRLGARFCVNGDDAAGVFRTKRRQRAWLGPTITSAVLARPPGGSDRPWFMMQNAGLPRHLFSLTNWSSGPLATPGAAAGTGGFGGLAQQLRALARAGDGLRLPPDSLLGRAVALTQRGLDLGEARQVVVGAVLEETRANLEKRLAWLPARTRIWMVDRAMARMQADVDQIPPERTEATAQQVGQALARGLQGLLDFDTDIDHRNILLAMGADPQPGRLFLCPADGPTGGHGIDMMQASWCPAQNRPLATAQRRLMRELTAEEAGTLRISIGWALTGKPVTVHAQGGCAEGIDAAHGVVDGVGQVHGHPGLYVMDAATLPGPVGVNPSATILARAERAIAHQIGAMTGVPFVAPELARAQRWAQDHPDPVHTAAALPGLPLTAPALGVRFRERLVGHVGAVGGAGPARFGAGERAGRAGAGERLVAELEVWTEDIDAYSDDPERALQLGGFIEWRGGRHAIDPAQSRLCLLPAARPSGARAALGHMAYEIVWGPEGRWRLVGHKHLRPGRRCGVQEPLVAAMLRESTCVDIQVSATGPEPVLAGRMRVHLGDLVQLQLPSFEVTGTDDWSEQLWVLGRLLGPFMGGMGRTYLGAVGRALLHGRGVSA